MEILTPENHAEEGKKAYQKGDYVTAVNSFQMAVDGYKAQNNELMAAEMANNVSVAYLQIGEAQLALNAVEGTEELFANNGEPVKAAMAAGNQAAALEGLGRLKEAEQEYIRCAAMLKELGELELRTDVMRSISALQLRAGRPLEAAASMNAGIADLDKPNLKQRILKRILNIPIKLINR